MDTKVNVHQTSSENITVLKESITAFTDTDIKNEDKKFCIPAVMNFKYRVCKNYHLS